MKKKITPILILIVLFFAGNHIQAQNTGSFNETISFNGEMRTLSFYVPTSYDSTKKYRLMVGLHGLGDNSSNYRNALINSLNWSIRFPNTIFVFPDGGSDQGKDFYSPPGDEEIIPKTIDYVMQKYWIDSAEVILQGFSLGGRSALKYGLDHPGDFFGLFLNTPAIQGMADAINDPIAGLGYNYKNASLIPIYITNGMLDEIYLSPIDIMYKNLILNDGITRKVTVPGLGHSVPAFTHYDSLILFFQNHTFRPYDMDVIETGLPVRSCNTTVPNNILVRNTGSKTITSATFDYEINGTGNSYTWTGNLGPWEHAVVSIPGITGGEGNNDLLVIVKSLNDTIADSTRLNNKASGSIVISTSGASLPLIEGFEDGNFPPDQWVMEETGNLTGWTIDNQVGLNGDYGIYAFNTLFLFYTLNYAEEFMTPIVDLTSISNPELTFNVSYNYFKYTPPYFISEVEFADTLEILVSTDCGETFESVYKKGGKELATFAEPILNPLSIPAGFIDPADSNWKKVKIDLSKYAGNTEATIKFSYISGQGGTIYLDDIAIDAVSGMADNAELNGLDIFPNPAEDNVMIRSDIRGMINVSDVSGKVVWSGISSGNNSPVKLNISGFLPGIYFVELKTNSNISVKKLIVK